MNNYKAKPFNLFKYWTRKNYNCRKWNNYPFNLSDEEYRKQPGFITSFDRFVDRKEGWKIAKSNNQIQFGNDDEDDVLISVY